MNKHVLHIVTSAVCILIPVIGLLYGLWDSHQPKTGPVGDGQPNYPTVPQLIPIFSCFIIGVLNLPLAIMRYRQNKKSSKDKES
ncbi:hypothetical protein FHS18_005547 [Paenibacillus phyllosphaerae]|uniref:Uncharacterized protein n=1 Tax=Paenibacillus phyllosphaerae TaxID=274593 RepID=A0A7W5B2W0_9BACL|nr:hypothetical protein [Paenibacillus phyllosphaerae]